MLKSITLFLLLITFPLQAEQFTNDVCSFTIDLPGPYYERELCRDGEAGNECTVKARYTDQTPDNALTADLTCVALSPEHYDIYQEESIALFIQSLYEDQSIDFDTARYSYEEDKERRIKNASSIAEGFIGNTQALFITVFWVSPNAVFTGEIRILGDGNNPAMHEKASRIIHSVKVKDSYSAPPQTPFEEFTE